MLAYNIFKEKPFFGIGYGGYSLTVGGRTIRDGDVLLPKQDVHSIYMRLLCEQGVIGFGFFLLILFRALRSGLQLFRISEQSFHKALGLGFMACVLAMAVSNLFGDRWSYFVLGGYFWISWGLVDRAILLQSRTNKW